MKFVSKAVLNVKPAEEFSFIPTNGIFLFVRRRLQYTP